MNKLKIYESELPASEYYNSESYPHSGIFFNKTDGSMYYMLIIKELHLAWAISGYEVCGVTIGRLRLHTDDNAILKAMGALFPQEEVKTGVAPLTNPIESPPLPEFNAGIPASAFSESFVLKLVAVATRKVKEVEL